MCIQKGEGSQETTHDIDVMIADFLTNFQFFNPHHGTFVPESAIMDVIDKISLVTDSYSTGRLPVL